MQKGWGWSNKYKHVINEPLDRSFLHYRTLVHWPTRHTILHNTPWARETSKRRTQSVPLSTLRRIPKLGKKLIWPKGGMALVHSEHKRLVRDTREKKGGRKGGDEYLLRDRRPLPHSREHELHSFQAVHLPAAAGQTAWLQDRRSVAEPSQGSCKKYSSFSIIINSVRDENLTLWFSRIYLFGVWRWMFQKL